MATPKKASVPKTKDQLVEEYSKILAEKKKELASIEAPRWKTPCSFKYSEGGSAINLHTVKDIPKLTAMLAFLISSERDYAEAGKMLDVDVVFKHQGHTLKEWAEDIKTEIGKINIASKREKIASLEKVLEGLESQESREAKQLASIEKELLNM